MRKALLAAAVLAVFARVPALAEDGRFRLHFSPVKGETFLVDSATGRAWQLVGERQDQRVFVELPVEIEDNPKHREFLARTEAERADRETREEESAAARVRDTLFKSAWYQLYRAEVQRVFEEKGFKVRWEDGKFPLTDPQGRPSEAERDFPADTAAIHERLAQAHPKEYEAYQTLSDQGARGLRPGDAR